MPIIPSTYVGLSSVNVVGSTESANTSYGFCTSFSVSLKNNEFIKIIGECTESIKRKIAIDIISGSAYIYWTKNETQLCLISQKELKEGDQLIDNDLDKLGVTIKATNLPCEFFVALKWDKDINFYIYSENIEEELMIPVKVRLMIGTGNNYIERNINDFDTDATQYLINLNKLKNSDSGITGYKLFDIFTFYPGKPITFNVSITNPTNYGDIALQLFDPINIGEALFDVANDVINLELNGLSDTFVGNITRNASYAHVANNQVIVNPDFSRHSGRFVAINQSSGMYDTAIIESYTANTDIYSGGTFTLTGEF
ncbi:hypothetical protein [Planktothrix sp. FACHB-1365]|uniref:hypothetical protein n=1 Tax=Planktothrix sp. FACHB-1365 TaxID=2692855 RepID=UPI001689F8C0|nr:hypothetical protein [Planktothrix sp. FACHB-1365]MBD2481541.1 hypothetical protein [Planktothrix sp. FACHB-1365]